MINSLSKLTLAPRLPAALELMALAGLGWLGWLVGQERLLLPWPGLAVWLTVGLVWLLPGLALLRMITPDSRWPWFGWLPLSFGLGLAWLMLPVSAVFYFNLTLDDLVWLVPRLNGLLLLAYGLLRLAGRLAWPADSPPRPPQGGEKQQILPTEGLGGTNIPPSGGLGGSNIPPFGGPGGADYPLLTRGLLVLAVLVQAALLWVFWDAYGFTTGGDEWSYMRLIQRFFGSETLALRAEPAELYFLILALVTRLSGAPLLEVYRLDLYLLLLIMASLGFLLLGQTLFQNRATTYLAFVIQGLYLLSDIHADANGAGLGLLARLPEDKFTAWLLLLPLTQTFFLMYVRSGQGRFLGLFAVMAIVNVVVHPIAAFWIVLSVGAAGLLFAGFGLRQRMLRFFAPFLVLLGLISFIGWWTQSFKTELTFDTSITTEALLTLSARRVYFFSVADNRYMGHPFLLSHPLVILAVLACGWLLFRLRRSLPAQFLLSNIAVVLLLIFNPITAPLIGQIVGFWQIYRVVWLLPVALTVGYALYEWIGMLSRVLAARRPGLASQAGWLTGGLLTAGLLLLTGLLAPHIAASWRSLHVWNGVTVTAAEQALTRYLAADLPAGRLLAPPTLGTRLGAQLSHLQPTTFRSSNPNIERFYSSPQLDQTALDLLQQFRVDYLIMERERPLAGPLRFMPGAFTLRYANPDYALYAWQPAQLSASERAIIEGNTQLGGGDLAAAEASYRQALGLEPDQPLAVIGLSRVYQAQGQAEQALNLLQAAVDRGPDNPWLQLELGQLLAQTAADTARLEQATAALAQAVSLAAADLSLYNAAAAAVGQLPPPARQSAAGQTLSAAVVDFFQNRAAAEPDDYPRQQQLARLYEQLGQPEQALAQYEQMTRTFPGAVDPYLQQGRIYEAQNKPDMALAAYQNAVKYQAQPESGWVYASLGRFQFSQGQFEEALQNAQQAAALARQIGDKNVLGYAYQLLGRIYQAQQQIPAAIDQLQLAIDTVPTDVQFYITLADLYRQQGDREQAVALFQQAIALGPVPAWVYLALGTERLEQGQLEAGLQALQQTVASDPTAATYLRVGELIQQYQGLAQAAPYYQQALALEPENNAANGYLASFYRQQGEYEQALFYAQQAVQYAATVQMQANAHLELALIYQAQQQPARALDHFQQAIDLVPDYAPFHAEFAAFLQQQGQLEQAIDQHRQAVALAPDNGWFRFRLGAALIEAGQPAEGRQELEMANNLAPDSFDIQVNIGAYLLGQGEAAAALPQLQQAVRLDPNHLYARHLLETALRQLEQPAAAAELWLNTGAGELYGHWLLSRQNDGNAAKHRAQMTQFPLTAIEPQPDPIASQKQAQALAGAAADGLWSRDKLRDILAYRVNADPSPAAETLLQEMISARPDDADLFYYLGELYRQQGQLEAARAAYRQALTLAPGFGPALWRLGQLAEPSDPAAARLVYRQLFQADPTNLAALHKLVQLAPAGEAAAWQRVLAAQAGQIGPTFSLSQTLANGWRLQGVQADEARLVRGESTPLLLYWQAPAGAQPGSTAGWLALGEGQWLQRIDQAQNMLTNGSFELGLLPDGSPAGFPADIYADPPDPTVRQVQLTSRPGISTTVALLANTPVVTRSSFVSNPLPTAADRLYLQGGWLQAGEGGNAFMGRRWRGQLPAESRPNSYLVAGAREADWQRYVGLAEPLPGSEQVEVWLLNAGGVGPVAFDDVFLVEIPPPDGS